MFLRHMQRNEDSSVPQQQESPTSGTVKALNPSLLRLLTTSSSHGKNLSIWCTLMAQKWEHMFFTGCFHSVQTSWRDGKGKLRTLCKSIFSTQTLYLKTTGGVEDLCVLLEGNFIAFVGSKVLRATSLVRADLWGSFVKCSPPTDPLQY